MVAIFILNGDRRLPPYKLPFTCFTIEVPIPIIFNVLLKSLSFIVFYILVQTLLFNPMAPNNNFTSTQSFNYAQLPFP